MSYSAWPCKNANIGGECNHERREFCPDRKGIGGCGADIKVGPPGLWWDSPHWGRKKEE